MSGLAGLVICDGVSGAFPHERDTHCGTCQKPCTNPRRAESGAGQASPNSALPDPATTARTFVMQRRGVWPESTR